MTSVVELGVLRKQTNAFISENPTDIVLNRVTARTSDGAGGWIKTQSGVPSSQSFRKIIQTKGNDARDMEGERVKPEFVLIGAHDADIQSGDTFVLNMINYRVEYVRDDRRYETWAEVVLDG